jgi:hypothetical protein
MYVTACFCGGGATTGGLPQSRRGPSRMCQVVGRPSLAFGALPAIHIRVQGPVDKLRLVRR